MGTFLDQNPQKDHSKYDKATKRMMTPLEQMNSAQTEPIFYKDPYEKIGEMKMFQNFKRARLY